VQRERDAAPSRVRRGPWIAAGLGGYLLAALFLTRPLALELTRALPSHWEADVVHHLWLQWWFAEALATGRPLFHSDVLHFPQQVNLHLADFNLALNALFYALERIAGTLLAWNLLLLASCVASGGTAWALATRCCGRGDAGWLAGLLFAASAYWRACALNAWLYLVQLWVLPLGLLATAHALRTRRARDAALAGLAIGVSFHVTPYYFLFLLGLLALLAPWFAAPLRAWLRGPAALRRVGAAAGTCLLLVLPRALPMWQAAQEPLVVHSRPADAHLAARPVELVWPWSSAVEESPTWGFRGSHLGTTLLGLLAFGAVAGVERRRLAPWLVSGGLFVLVALGPYAEIGSLRIPLPGLALSWLPGAATLTNPWRFVLPALLCLTLAASLAAAELLRRVEGRWRGAGLALVVLVGGIHVAEIGLAPPFPHQAPLWRDEEAPIARRLRDDVTLRAVLDLSRHAKRNQRVHGKAIVGGWLPRMPVAVQEETARLLESVRSATSEERAAVLGRHGIGAVILDDTRGWRIRPDPTRVGGFREERLLVER
jgi:hypothetical protein